MAALPEMSREYRGIVALNNLGCSLLERGCIRQARAALLDAIVLMKSVSAPSFGSSRKRMDRDRIDGLVRRAMQRLSPPFPGGPSGSSPFVVLSDDICHSLSLKALADERPGPYMAVVLRMEDYGCENVQGRNMEADSCVLLQNYAACLLVPPPPADAGPPRAGSGKTSSRILRLTLQMLSRQYRRALDAYRRDGAPLDLAHCYGLLAAACVATYNLRQAALVLQRRPAPPVAEAAGRNAGGGRTGPAAMAPTDRDCAARLRELYERLRLLDAPGDGGGAGAAAAAA